MGNRAVLTASTDPNLRDSNDIGVYLHWNGGRDSVEGFLAYCKMRGFRAPDDDTYGWARFCQIVANYFGGDGLSLGVGRLCELDCEGDNGVYIIQGWDIVGRRYFDGDEQTRNSLEDMLIDIDKAQPYNQSVGLHVIQAYIKSLRKDEREEA